MSTFTADLAAVIAASQATVDFGSITADETSALIGLTETLKFGNQREELIAFLNDPETQKFWYSTLLTKGQANTIVNAQERPTLDCPVEFDFPARIYLYFTEEQVNNQLNRIQLAIDEGINDGIIEAYGSLTAGDLEFRSRGYRMTSKHKFTVKIEANIL